MARSNPKSANYGKHMSAREVVDFFSPPEASVNIVTEWLKDSGIDAERLSQSANKQVSAESHGSMRETQKKKIEIPGE